LKAKGSNEKVKNIEKLKMINVVNNEKFLTKLILVLFPINLDVIGTMLSTLPWRLVSTFYRK
jgi:hypothetical protein